jgi:hypothetical protein
MSCRTNEGTREFPYLIMTLNSHISVGRYLELCIKLTCY